MDFKKKMKAFFTLKRRANDGFTLVELIVVIAILAILAGVGTAGYSGYIKSANKGADKTLVGNVVRAVETGHNSYAFQLNEVLQAASDQGIQVPIGFVVLTENGCTTVQSGNKESEVMGAECVVEENATICINPSRPKRSNGAEGCDEETKTAYLLTDDIKTTRTFCKTHSYLVQTKKNVDCFTNLNDDTDLSVEKRTFYYVSDESTLDALVTDHENGKVIADMPVYGSNPAVENDANSSITKAITAAFGSDYIDSMKLKYDGWEMNNLSSFFMNATDTWGELKGKATMAVTLETVSSIIPQLSGLSLKQNYKDEEVLVNDYSSAMATRFSSREEYAAMWNTILSQDKSLIQNSFNQGTEAGVGVTDAQEDAFYFAGRGLWNQSLGTYIADNSTCPNRASHAKKVKNYGVYGMVPKACTYHSFTTTIESFGQTLEPIGCETCRDAAVKYVESGAATADAYALFDTFRTIDAVATDGVINGDEYKEVDFFDFFEAYLREFNSLYSTVEDIDGESKIAITFFYSKDQLTYEVSNLEADPRNK